MKDNELKFEIVEHVFVIGGPHAQGWTKELNKVSWNDKPPKYEIRDWSPDHSRCGKGATFTEEELKSLADQIQGLF